MSDNARTHSDWLLSQRSVALAYGSGSQKLSNSPKHLWLLGHPIKFGQFYKNSIFGRFNEHPTSQSKWFRDAPACWYQVI